MPTPPLPPTELTPEVLAGLVSLAKYGATTLAAAVGGAWTAAKTVVPKLMAHEASKAAKAEIAAQVAPQIAEIKAELRGKANADDLTDALKTIGHEMGELRREVGKEMRDINNKVGYVAGAVDTLRGAK